MRKSFTKKQRKQKGAGFFILGILLALAAFFPTGVLGQINLNTVPASTFGLGTTDLLDTVIRIVQWALGILGLVAVIIIMYGGFLWLTAAGREDQIRKAKRVLTQAVIGLVIILLAWAIVSFIVNAVTNATGSGSASCTNGTQIGWPSCQLCASGSWVVDPAPADPLCTWSGGPTYDVRWEIPTDGATDVSLCSIAGAGFDGVTPPWLNPSTVDSTTVIMTDSASNQVTGTYTVPPSSNFFEFKSDADLLANENYQVQITTGVESTGGVPATGYTWQFTTGVTSDALPPTVINWGPQGANVCLSPTIQVQFNEPMAPSSMVASNITLSPADATITSVFMSGPNNFTASLSNPLNGNTAYTITLNADTTTGFRDTCYNALDCGNTPDVCTSDGVANGTPVDDFVWTFTTDDTTEIDCRPEITGIDPLGAYSHDGADAITIQGKNLGILADTVFFPNKYWGSQIDATDVTGVTSQCFNTDNKPNNSAPPSIACVTSWSDTQITSVIPAGRIGDIGSGATDGDMRVRRGGVEISDPASGFNNVVSPHVRALSPAAGGEGQYVSIIGENFTSTPGQVWFRRDDGYEVQASTCSSSGWTDNQITVIVPTGTSFVVGDQIHVQVDNGAGNPNGNDRSNLYTFTFTGAPPTPGICTITPSCHNNAPSTVSLDGEFFGATTGMGYYSALGPNAPNVYNGTVASWNDTQVQLTSPATLPNDEFYIRLEDAGGVLSNPMYYKVPCDPAPYVIMENQCAPPGVMPRPNPYPETQQICTNLRYIDIHFSDDMTLADLNLANMEINECTGEKTGCTTRIGPVGSNIPPAPRTWARYHVPAAGLNTDTWYQFVVPGSTTSTAGVSIGTDTIWYFKTRTDPTPCEADYLGLDVTNFGPGVYSEPNTSHPNTIEYTGSPITNSCQLITAPGSWSWNVTDTAEAVCTPPGCGTTDVQTVDTILYDPLVDDGLTSVEASLGSLSAVKQLNVKLNYCQTSADCTCNGNPGVCNQTAQQCEPYVEDVQQPSGPEDTLVTVSGCFFGTTPGQVEFIDQAPPNDAKLGVNLCTLPQWSNTSIKIGTPDHALGTVTDVNVRSVYGPGQYLDSSTMGIFTYADTCGGVVPPAICSSYPPKTGEGTNVQISGLNLPNGANPNDEVLFTPGLSSPSVNWSASPTAITGVVPVGAVTAPDNLTVQKDYGAGTCLSNPDTVEISCDNNSQCGTGCCVANACVDHIYCEAISAGTQCTVPSNPDPTCQVGHQTDPLGVLTCISNAGFTESKNPPPPPFGTQCQFCCDPDPNNDGDNSDADVNTAGLSCTPILASVTTDPTCRSASDDPTQQRGLFCGCSTDLQCGSGTGCAEINDPYRCCRAEPTFSSVSPNPAVPVQCQNQVFSYVFFTGGATVIMDQASMNASTITVEDGGGAAIPGSIVSNPTGFDFYPKDPFLVRGSTITITVSTAVQNFYGINIPAPVSHTWNVAGGATLCSVDKVVVENWNMSTVSLETTPAFIRCALNGCVSDFLGGITPGAQTYWAARAQDNNNNYIAGPTYVWDDTNKNGIFDFTHHGSPPYNPGCLNGGLSFHCLSTANPVNGVGSFDVTADGGAALGSATGRGTEINFLCEKPWPDPATAAAPFNTWPFHDSDDRYHFSTYYCRDGGLPELRLGSVLDPPVNSPLVVDGTIFNPSVDDKLREYLFIVTDELGNRIGRDAIGMRIMENELHLPPDLWYKRAFPSESQDGQYLEVAGFPAWRVGNTTYVGATNVDDTAPGANLCAGPGTKCSNGVMYSNIYIVSHSDGATGETVSIYNRFLDNLTFNTNVDVSFRDSIKRDVKRVGDLTRVAIKLSDYKKQTGDYPKLTAGTFIDGMSVSTWPSWNETLGPALNADLLTDPNNTMAGCAASFDPTTCWDETAKEYDVGFPSYVYQYEYLASTNRSNLFARLEYQQEGSWRRVPLATDVMTGVCPVTENPQWASAQCDTNFNFQYQSAEFEAMVTMYQTSGALDVDPPENLTLSGFSAPIDSSRTLTATATDDRPTDQGMDRVEFFHKASAASVWTPDYTDATESDGWVWTFDPSSSPAGNYDFRIRAFDRAGNYTDFVVANVAVAPTLADLEAPEISGFAVGPVTTTMEDTASIAAAGITSASPGSVLYVDYWSTPATIQRCNDLLTYCSTLVTAPNNPLPPGNDGPENDYYWIGEDKARPSDFLATYTPLDVPNSTYPPRKVQRFSRNMSPGASPTAEYDVFNVTHAVGMSNGNLAAVTSFNTIRVFDTADAVYNPAAGQNTQIASVAPGGTIKGIEADNSGNIYVSHGNTVSKYDSSLNFINSYGGLSDPYGIDAATDRIYVAEQASGNVLVLDTALTQILETYTGFSGLVDVFEKDGDVYVANGGQINKFTPVREVVGNVNLSVDAFDNTAVTKVEFYLDASKIAETTSGNPYVYSWDSSSISDGDYSIYAVAFDAAGNTTITKQQIGIRNGNDAIPPSVFISDPSQGDSVSGVVQISATASDNQGIQDVRLQVDGVDWDPTLNPLFPNPDPSSPYNWAWDSFRDAVGAALPVVTSVQLTVVATDINGNTNSDSITVQVDNSAGGIPSVWFIDPENNDIFGPGQFQAYATDPDGTIDHLELYNTVTSDLYDVTYSPIDEIYYLDWPPTSSFSTKPPDGSYQLHLIAEDSVGNRSSATAPDARVNVTIDTVPPVVTAFSPPDATTLTGVESFSATATDLNGIDKLEFYLMTWPPNSDPLLMGTCDDPTPSSPYSCTISYDTATVSNGAYIGVAYAYDEAGLTSGLVRWDWIIDNATPSGFTEVPAYDDMIAGADNIYKIAGGSNTWNIVQALAAGESVRNIRTLSSGMYAVTYSGTPGGGHVYQSTDAGDTWTQLPTPAVEHVYDIVEIGTTLYIGTGSSRTVYSSADFGNTWTSMGSPFGTSSTTVLALENVSGTLYASIGHDVSYWNGSSWVDASYVGLNGGVDDIVEFNGNIYVQSGASRVYSQPVGGGAWTERGYTGSVGVYTFAESGGSLFLGNFDGGLYQFDGTSSWTLTGTLPGTNPAIPRLLNETGNLYVGGGYLDGAIQKGAVFFTTDNGATWERIGQELDAYVFGVSRAVAAAPPSDTTPPTDPAISLSPEHVWGGTHYSTTNSNSFNPTGQVFIESVSDDAGSGIAYIDIFVDGVLVDPNTDGYTCLTSELTGGNTCRVQWTGAAAGSHAISSNSQDIAGNPSASTISVTGNIDNTNPLVQITSPINNFNIGGTTSIRFNASDGSGSGIQEVSTTYDPGSVLIGTDAGSPWLINWDTTAVSDGPYDLSSLIIDNVGNSSTGITDTIRVNVNNTSGINCGTNICTGSSLCCSTTCYNPSTHQCCSGSVIPIGQICRILLPR